MTDVANSSAVDVTLRELSPSLMPLVTPVVFFACLIVPAVWLTRRWYAQQQQDQPLVEACCGAREKAEASPLLNTGPPTPPLAEHSLASDARDLTICVVGVMASHLIYGFYQELLMTKSWGADPTDNSGGEAFSNASFTTLLNRLCSLALAVVAAVVGRVLSGERMLSWPAAPLWEYSVGALANNVSSVAQYSSLHFISFPTLVLSKACKMPPVMLVNVLVFRRSYRAFEYTGAFLVLMGAFFWLLYDSGSEDRHEDNFRATDTPSGILLVVLYILADAYASTWQGSIFNRGTSIYPMFFWSNAWAVLFSSLSTFTTSEFANATAFLARHPEAWWALIPLSISSASGNLFLLYTIQRFGPLTFASIATVRQLLSSFISVAQFHHIVHLLQIVGLLIVFAALGMITRIKVHERSISAKRAARQEQESAAAADKVARDKEAASAAPPPRRSFLGYGSAGGSSGGDGGSKAEPLAEIAPAQATLSEMSTCGQTCERWSSLPCLSPPGRALFVLSMVVFVAVCKSWLTRSSILSTQHMSAPDAPVQTTGVAFSALSCASTVLFAIFIFIIEPGCLSTPDSAIWPAMLVVTFFSAVDLGCTNAAIARLTAPLQQVLAALNPIFTVLLESGLGCQVKHPFVYATVASLTTGAVLVAYSHLSGPLPENDNTAYGTALMLMAVFASALKYVLLRKLSVRTRQSIGTISFVFWVDMLAFLALSLIALFNNEFTTLVQSLQAAGTSQVSLSTVVFISASLGGVRFLTEVYALRFVAAIDLSAAKSLANVCFVVISLAFPLSFDQYAGTLTTQYFAYFIIGLFLVFGSLFAYWFLQRWLGPERLILAKIDGGPWCMRIREWAGEEDEVSDLARSESGPPLVSLPGCLARGRDRELHAAVPMR